MEADLSGALRAGFALVALALAAGPCELLAGPSPDLAILSVQPENYLQGATAQIRFQVVNDADQPSDEVAVAVLLSADDRPSTEDAVVAAFAQEPVSPGGNQRRAWSVATPLVTGDYWLFVCSNWTPASVESETTCSEPFQWSRPPWDLTVTSLQLVPERTVPGNRVSVGVAILNDGTADSQPSRVRIKLSRNENLSQGDPDLAVLELDGLEPRGRTRLTSDVPVDRTVGTWWIGACIDPVPGEGSATNNCSFPTPLEVVENRFPDLAVDVVRVRPEHWDLGQSVDLYAEVLNIGTARAPATEVVFLLSTDSDVTDDDIRIGTAVLDSVRGESIGYANLFADPGVFPGTYWLGACVNAPESENEVFNNCLTGPVVEITERGLDLH